VTSQTSCPRARWASSKPLVAGKIRSARTSSKTSSPIAVISATLHPRMIDNASDRMLSIPAAFSPNMVYFIWRQPNRMIAVVLR